MTLNSEFKLLALYTSFGEEDDLATGFVINVSQNKLELLDINDDVRPLGE